MRRLGLLIIALALVFATFGRTTIDGDGTEYVMMTHAFLRHGTPEIKPSDIAEVVAWPAAKGLPAQDLARLPQALGRDASIYAGFTAGRVGGIQAIHFWMYSLLATPFYAVTDVLGKNPALAFAALNLLIVAVTARCILRWLPRAGLEELAILALLGPVFYLRWTGPEVFSACCALLAMLALIRRDVALSVALAGFGATQNPSIAGLIFAAGAYRLLLAVRPAWSLYPERRFKTARNAALVAAGILLAALPYLHNEILFGVPSIIAASSTDPNLITRERLVSFFFDLSQGMVVGLPGLAIGLFLLPALMGSTSRFRWLVHAAAAACLMPCLALPALSALNWNSGYVVFLRYAYWAATPAIAICLVGLTYLSPARRAIAMAVIAACQLLVLWQAHWPRTDSNAYHSALARRVLDVAPGWYNPDPEIFYERETHKEQLLATDRIIVHRGPAGPTKIMRFWMNTADTAGLCAPGQALTSPATRTASGWEYVDAPFRCGAPDRQDADWVFGAGNEAHVALLGGGWSQLEPNGIWTDGARTTLTVPLPQDRRFELLGIDGTYFRPGTLTDLTINDVHLGKVRLGAGPIPIPPSARHAGALRIVLAHPHPVSPASLGMSADRRLLSFFLRRIHLEAERSSK